MKEVLVFGPTSWDTVIRIESYPENGGFAQSLSRAERAGGAGLNVAAAVSSAKVHTKLFSYVGTDDIGKKLKKQISKIDLRMESIKVIAGTSLHALITLDPFGERTVFALEKNRLAEIDFNIEFSKNQIVVFPVWRDFYLSYLEKASQSGAQTVVGLGALQNQSLSASFMIGSDKDISDSSFDTNRFATTIITRGAKGVLLHTANKLQEFPVKMVTPQDATGAGDSFLAGVIVGLVREVSLETCIQMGINWASASIAEVGSLPPIWREEFAIA